MVRDGHYRQAPRHLLILAGERERVAAWVASHIRPAASFGPAIEYEALGVLNAQGALIGGAVFYHYSEIAPGQHDVSVCVAGEPGWTKRGVVRELFRYPFVQLGCVRISARTAKANVRVRRQLERLGFILEGKLKNGFGVGKDALIYAMQRADCRWISEEDRHHGQHAKSA